MSWQYLEIILYSHAASLLGESGHHWDTGNYGTIAFILMFWDIWNYPSRNINNLFLIVQVDRKNTLYQYNIKVIPAAQVMTTFPYFESNLVLKFVNILYRPPNNVCTG